MIRLSLGLLLAIAATTIRASDPEFSIDVMSVLSKAGCNAGTCHGNLNGKGGFKLSLRGQDAEYDFHSLVLASRGRRVNRTAPELSLFLRKATGEVGHRGGIRIEQDSPEYQLLLEWLRGGAAGPSHDAAQPVRLEVEPRTAITVAPDNDVQVRVKAWFSDGSSRDVTNRACYELSNLNAQVEAGGRVVRSKFGETTLIVRYLNQQLPVSIAFTEAKPDFRWSDPPVNNEIDRHVFAKLKRLRINPSPLCDDSVFVRRAYLDAIGRAPTAAEAKSFVQDTRPDKRQRLVDQLLSRSEFSDFWAIKWADLLRTEEKVLDLKGVVVFHGWIRDSIAEARPLDQFVRELVSGTGSTFENPPANYYRANRDPSTRGETTSRLFLGIRLQCAKCHNHPFDRWTQDDYYRWSSLFSQIDYEVGDNKRRDGLDKNEFVGEQFVKFVEKDEVRNPNTGDVAPPKFLGADELAGDDLKDRIASLAEWLTSPENELFAQSQANFIWYQMMGRGLVDPIDDFRSTNPPSNPALLSALSNQLVESGFDIRSLVRMIMNSRVYQLSSVPNESNLNDQTSYSRALVRRLPAEVLLDMQSDVLGSPATFGGYRKGIRAVQIPGVRRVRRRDGEPKSGDRFLKTFGKPERILACDCERSNETTLKQAFVLLGDGLNERLASPSTRIHELASSELTHDEVIDQLYWAALSRPPSESEREAALRLIEKPHVARKSSFRDIVAAFAQGPKTDRSAALEDIAWALMNAKEFLFRR